MASLDRAKELSFQNHLATEGDISRNQNLQFKDSEHNEFYNN